MPAKTLNADSQKRLVRRLRRLARDWPAGAILIHFVDGSGLTLYTAHPEDGGRPVESFRIHADSVTGEPTNRVFNKPGSDKRT